MFSHALHTRQALFGNFSYPNSTSRLSRSIQVSIKAEAMDGLKQTANGVGHAIQKGIQKAGEATSGQACFAIFPRPASQLVAVVMAIISRPQSRRPRHVEAESPG